MRILFDNNAFAYLSQEPQRVGLLNHLKELVDCRKVEVVGSCTMLEELAGLSKSDFTRYLNSVSLYEELTNGKILKPWNELVRQEGEQLRPVLYENSIFDKSTVQKLFSLFKDRSQPISIFNEAYTQRQSYKKDMDEASQDVLSDPCLINKPNKAIIEGYKDWSTNFDRNAQDFFVDLFKVKANISYKELPHIAAFLGYILTRIYECSSLGLANRDTDLYDRAHFTDAAVVDILVTNDEVFIRTCLRVSYRSFDVIRTDDLASLIERWHAT
ncbi:MAG TPA: hypothetical protein VFF49_03655 [Thermodesulfobacteriota bacterium]|nr:hypothetical protein [Thermodesulfobacteriota bacterium]